MTLAQMELLIHARNKAERGIMGRSRRREGTAQDLASLAARAQGNRHQ